jgi:hypothetical protein
MQGIGRSVRMLAVALGFAIAIVLGLTVPLVQHSDSNCDAEAFLTSPGQIYSVTAERVYVNPKAGRHQVFGVFVVPDGVKQWEPGMLSVDAVGIYCSRVQRYGSQYEDIVAPEKSIVILDFVRTRTALGLFLQGKMNHLRDRKTWRYFYKLQSD